MPFQPGNQEGAKSQKPKPFRDALFLEAAALENDTSVAKHPRGSLRWNAQRLLLSGEVPAIKEVADRMDGRVPQSIEAPAGTSGKLVIEWMSGE